jgi:hypothetical protein
MLNYNLRQLTAARPNPGLYQRMSDGASSEESPDRCRLATVPGWQRGTRLKTLANPSLPPLGEAVA